MPMPLDAATAMLSDRLSTRPTIALIAGSGIIRALDRLSITARHPMTSIPGMPVPTVAGHGATIDEASLDGHHLLVFTGRTHLYEGRGADAATAQIDLIAGLGIRRVIVTNAVGGLHPSGSVGDIALPDDVIDLTFSPWHHAAPMRTSIDHTWWARTRAIALAQGIATTTGTLVQVSGPSYETRAEIRMLRRMGADLVGMSTAIEVKRACALSMRALVCSMVTNVLTDTERRTVTHDDVLGAAERSVHAMSSVIAAAVRAADGLSL
jgi:purine-nucleoside phosphorylase